MKAATYVPRPGTIPTLPVPSLAGVRRAHLIGIGGAGMRNLAKLLIARGVAVSGSDLKDSKGVEELRRLGADAAVGHDPEHVRDPDVVIVSSAIGEQNSELAAARARSIPVWARAQALAAIASGKVAVAVAGTHGKTTTTSMIAVVLERAGLDPTYLIGGDLNEAGSGARHGEGEAFVFEADESDGSFLLARPAIGIITNIEVDHVDFFRGGISEIVRAFEAFASGCDLLVACGDDRRAADVAEHAPGRVIRYGTGEANDVVVSVEVVGPQGSSAALILEDGHMLDLRLPVDGVHNLLDATAAILVARELGVDELAAAEGLSTFGGVRRRFERRGSARGAEFYDDYGHVPTELAVTLEVARRMEPGRLVVVFQPHRYSRTQALWRELGASMVAADVVIVTDVYGADQDPIPGITGKLVVDGVSQAEAGVRVVYLPHRGDVVSFLAEEVRAGDLVLTMGCGDVWMLGDAAMERIQEGDA